MRFLAAGLSIVLATPLFVGCATTMASNSGSERVVVAVDTPPETKNEVVEVTEVVAPVQAQTEAPRRRLSQVVTLGQSEPPYPTPMPQPGAAGGPNVIVNNNITVVNGQPVYGGYYGGYGYGSRSGYGGYSLNRGDGRGTTSTVGPTGATTRGWAPTGWEGAQRTAAPGRTPGVGGNFSAPPDSGPRQMK